MGPRLLRILVFDALNCPACSTRRTYLRSTR